MFRVYLYLALVAIVFTGCNNQASTDMVMKNTEDDPTEEAQTSGDGSSTTTTSDASQANESTSAPGETSEKTPAGGSFELTSENTTIQFVGTHADPDNPDPRTCTFDEFTGKIEHADGKVTSIAIEIDTNAITTFSDRLTTHLKSPDFLDVRKYPKATFNSTSIESKEGDQLMVTGELTLLETTKEISFPATATATDGNVQLNSTFEINRTDFGVNYDPSRVLDPVAITVTVGK